jgi:hypothetical protein
MLIETRFTSIPNDPWSLFAVWTPETPQEFREVRRALDGRDVFDRIDLLPCARLRGTLEGARTFGRVEVRVLFVEARH